MKIAPVNLIVSDTGPLISLAVINRLDLLTTFDRPVWITDVVQSECTRDPSKAGAAALKAFFDEGHPFTPRILETPHGAEYRAIIASNPADIEERLRNLGEQSIEHVLKRVSVKAKSFSQEVFSLCVSDDKEFLKTDQPNTHMLSTRAFLVALERKGLIASAEALRDEIKILEGRRSRVASLIGYIKQKVSRPITKVNFVCQFRTDLKRPTAKRRSARRLRNNWDLTLLPHLSFDLQI